MLKVGLNAHKANGVKVLDHIRVLDMSIFAFVLQFMLHYVFYRLFWVGGWLAGWISLDYNKSAQPMLWL